MILGKFIKQPTEVLDFEFDFTAWLADKADTISGTPTVVSVPKTAGATNLTISSISTSGGVVRFFAAGGIDGVSYEITCTFNTASSPARTKQDEMIIIVRET